MLAGRVAPASEVADWVAWLPEGSAVHRATDPQARTNPELDMLRRVEHNTRWLAWAKSRDAQHNRGIPEPIRFPWEPNPDAVWAYDVLDWDEAAEKLGGDPRMAELMAKL